MKKSTKKTESKSTSLRFRPPKGFVAAGQVVSAEIAAPPHFAKEWKRGGRRGEGIRYERRVQGFLAGSYNWRYLAGPWFRYCRADGKLSWCQPDGLLFNFQEGIITIVEIKLSHTEKAWWQLRKLYEPVLRVAFPQPYWRFALLEVVSSCDPHKAFPERFGFVSRPHETAPGGLSVHIVSKRMLNVRGF